jgi:uncharacterized protein YndB with AHSA1/START domain
MSEVSAHAKMLIRAPVAEVFDAFADPRRISEFWLKSSSGPLARGAHVEWEFMLPGARETVDVISFARNEHIEFRWSSGFVVDITFRQRADGTTRTSVIVSGFSGPDSATQAVNATEGFAIVLCDLKTLLETGKSGGMVRDKAIIIAEEVAATR